MKKSAIDQLFEWVLAEDYGFHTTCERDRLLMRLSELSAVLSGTLGEGSRKQLDEFCLAYNGLVAEEGEIYFKIGLRLGLKLAAECLN